MRISWWKQIEWGYSTFNSDSTFISLYLLLSDRECSIKEGRRLARQASQWMVPLNKKVSNVKKNLSLWHCFWRSVFSHLIMKRMSLDNGTLDSHSEILVRMAWTCSWILESWWNFSKVTFTCESCGWLTGGHYVQEILPNLSSSFTAPGLDMPSSKKSWMTSWEGMSQALFPESIFGR